MAYYMGKGYTVESVLNLESSYWDRLNIIDTEDSVVCYSGEMAKYMTDESMSEYRNGVNSLIVSKATTNGETLNLFVQREVAATLTLEEVKTAHAVFHELINVVPYNKVNAYLGSETIARMDVLYRKLHDKLYPGYDTLDPTIFSEA